MIADLSVAVALFALLMVALELGFRAGRRALLARQDGEAAAGGQVGAIQGATLGLLGLLLAFSFSAAGSRFLERQDLVVAEANAIGTACLRADLLDEAHRTDLRQALRRYTERRLEISAQLRHGISAEAVAEMDQLLGRVWEAAVAGVAVRPAAMLGVLPPVNEVIDLHSLRLAAGRKHLPALVLGMLIACSALAIGVIGYGCGMGGRRRIPLTVSLALLIGAGLWVTIDLDHARSGLMQISDAALQALTFDG
jgi:hypothetical protein